MILTLEYNLPLFSNYQCFTIKFFVPNAFRKLTKLNQFFTLHSPWYSEMKAVCLLLKNRISLKVMHNFSQPTNQGSAHPHSEAASSVSLLMWLIVLVLAVCLSVILIMSFAIIIVYCRKRQKVRTVHTCDFNLS